jgi:WD40 repeat protein
MKLLASFIVGTLLIAAIPTFAHHSFAAEFDINKTVTLKGVVTKIEWMNPHAWFYVDVTAADGKIEHWQCETGAPIELLRRGWKKSDMKVGDQVTVQGYRAKDGTNTANARLVTLPDGKKIFSGSADDGGPTQQPPATTTSR